MSLSGSSLVAIELDHWSRAADDLELRLLARLKGSVIDVGCGPGRLVEALSERGVSAFGIDKAAAAVDAATARGASASQHCVFSRLPDEGRWASALLFDGNIGIGGDPLRLLARVAELLAPGGVALVEVEEAGAPFRVGRIALRYSGAQVGHYPWAWVGRDDISWLADRAGLVVDAIEDHDDRSFAWLRRPAN